MLLETSTSATTKPGYVFELFVADPAKTFGWRKVGDYHSEHMAKKSAQKLTNEKKSWRLMKTTVELIAKSD